VTARFAFFQPMRLQAAVVKAVELHPATAAQLVSIDESSLPALRRRVVRAAGSAAALESLALELSPREVRGLLTGLVLWEDLREAVMVLLGLRLRASHLPMLWKAWQRLPLLVELRELVGRLPAEAWQFLPPAFAPLAPAWVAVDQPGVALQAWLDKQQMTHSDLPLLGGAGFMADTPLLRLVHEAVLTHGSATQLRRETGSALVRLGREMPVEGTRMLFGRNYLARFAPNEWLLPVVEEVRTWYGLPRRPRLPRFWEAVPEQTRDAFQQLFIRKTLERVFRDDERSRYWLRWVSALDDAHEGDAAGTPYVIMLFPKFGVIEFLEWGKAAYFYDRAKAESFAGRRANSPADLREVLFPRIGWFGDNRLIHRDGWTATADNMVAGYTRHYGGR
jgi:hypothetical protein